MTKEHDMTETLAAQTAAELKIRNAIARIALLADQGDLDDYLDQFTEDSLWAFPSGPRQGRADIRAGAEERRAGGVTGPGSNTRHVITTVSVQLEAEDTAGADSYFLFYQNTTTAPTLFNMGHYRDTFTRQGDVWRLARRHITLG
jgi:3-phenylpropionate/cinnamic acid dioxygenase small subunit